MEIKRMVKRILALGTGATMVGATMMGALAADLSDYPTPWHTDGVFNGKIVVGEAAQSVDTIVATDIATAMWYSKKGEVITAVSGDAWKVGTTTEFFEMSHTPGSGLIANKGATNARGGGGGEAVRDITQFIDGDELKALADVNYETSEKTVTLKQQLAFDGDNATAVMYAENDADVTADFFVIPSGHNIGRYIAEFSPGAESDFSGTTLADFEGTKISFFGREYQIVAATVRVAAAPAATGVKLTLLSGSAGGTLTEGVPATHTIDGKDYTVELIWIDDDEAKYDVNGQVTTKLKKGDTYTLADGLVLGISDILYSGKTGVDSKTTYWLGANKVVIDDSNITDGTPRDLGAQSLVVASETIEDAKTTIIGSNTSSKLTIDSIFVNMTADDDFFVGVGEKLSKNSELSEPQVLFTENWDIEYQGLSQVATHEIALKARSSTRYDIRFTDGDGNVVDMPLVFTSGTTVLKTGDASDRDTVISEAARFYKTDLDGSDNMFETGGNDSNNTGFNITKNDYVLLTDTSQSAGSRRSWVLQYKGVDAIADASPQIRFKNLGSGETIEKTWKNNTGATADGSLTLGGRTFNIFSIEGMGGGPFQRRNQSGGLKDEHVWIDLDSSGNTQPVANTTYIADKYGAELRLFASNGMTVLGAAGSAADGGLGASNASRNWNSSGLAGFGIHINMTTPDSDDYDDIAPTPNFGFNISAASGKVASTTAGGVTFKTPQGVDDYSYAYTSMGSFITNFAPTNDPREITIDYPENQRLPLVYYTAGSTATSKTAGGDLSLVSVPVGATVFDSEVDDLEAQNTLVVGGPCVNTHAAALLGNPADCTEGFTAGVARIKMFEHANGNMALLVAGYSGADTRLAGRVLADYRARALSGKEVEVEGTSLSDAVVRKVSAE